jgi:predicted Zn-dependent protease
VFGVIENDSINAFSAPGGYVVITTGLMRLAKNEAQLAAILGHEIGHVVNKDVIKSYASVKHTVCVPAVTAAAYIQYGVGDSLPAEVRSQADFAQEFDKPGLDPAAGGFIDALTNGVLNLRKTFGAGKDAEFAADRVGFELMMFAGYDTNEFDKVIRKAEQGGKSFNNHPGNVDRLKNFTALRTGKPAEGREPAEDNYKDFNTGGAVPAIPAEVKAAVPPEGAAGK